MTTSSRSAASANLRLAHRRTASNGWRDHGWADLFAEIARAFSSGNSPSATLSEITSVAMRYVPGCDHCGVSLIHEWDRRSTDAATDDVPTRVDQLQYRTDQGPSLDAIRDQHTVLVEDLSSERRWPAFSAQAVELTGVRSLLAVRLFTDTDTIGTITFYSRTPAAFDADAQAVAAILATHATIAIIGSRERALANNLLNALSSSREIGTAVGLLMAQCKQDRDEAFELLRDASQRLNIRVSDLANHIIAAGKLDMDDLRHAGQR
jgi:GAF domain-containing protein